MKHEHRDVYEFLRDSDITNFNEKFLEEFYNLTDRQYEALQEAVVVSMLFSMERENGARSLTKMRRALESIADVVNSYIGRRLAICIKEIQWKKTSKKNVKK